MFTSGKVEGGKDALLLPFWQGKEAEPAFKDKGSLKLVAPALKSADFTGKAEELLCFYSEKGEQRRILLVGLGEKKGVTQEVLRRSYAGATRFLLGKKAKNIALVLPETSIDRKQMLTATVEGILLSNYAYDVHKSDKKTSLLEKVVLQDLLKDELLLCKKLSTIASSVYMARDLVNGNADEVTPLYLAKQAQTLAKDFSTIKTTVMNRAQMEKEKMGLLLAVSRASANEPTFIVIHYKGKPSSKSATAIVGKGITYDTGGLNLKPQAGMLTMRDDMAGAAVVLGTLRAAAELKMPVNLVGVIASTENSIGPASYKLGDVYKSHAGVTVEITDTDAEGRLVLADALSYVQTHFAPEKIVDLATLTGGAIVALGEEVAPICCNDDRLARQLFEAGEATYERLWRLPLYQEFEELLKSKIADIKNSGPRKASSICGAIFLSHFIKKGTPWAHLDIAGVAFPEVQKPYHPTQATGYGVRLLIEFLERSL